jgi:hypothetical protein
MKLKAKLLAGVCASALVGLVACKPSGSNPSPAGYSGVLMCGKISGEAFHYVIIDSAFEAIADFTANPATGAIAWVDSVTVNGIELEPDGDSVGYIASDFQNRLNFSAGANWVVKGANGITSFSYNDTHPYPSYTAMPDTVYRASGFTFPFNSTAAPATDSLVIEVDTGGGMPYVKGVSGGGGITLSSAELSAMKSDSTIIVLHAAAKTDQVFGGQRFAFIKTRVYYKTVYIK